EMPDLANGPITPEMNRWMGRATSLVEMIADPLDVIQLKTCVQYLAINRAHNAQAIPAIVHSALGKAEIAAPAGMQGAFIPIGNPLDALVVVSKVFAEAKVDILIVDPYADLKVLDEFARTAPQGVSIRVLADQAAHKPSLKPAAERWVLQFASTRPLEVRL